MAKRYDNNFDAEGFVDNFRAQDDTPPPHLWEPFPKGKTRRGDPERKSRPNRLMITKPSIVY